ncbi:MAG: hypothetical protein RIQ37_5 [Actinomycetota bacterium]|jgi:uncharacterized membrane protein
MRKVLKVILGLALVFAGTGHLTFARTEFVAQVPPWLPFEADLVVLASGVVEIILGTGLIAVPKYTKQFGIATAIFFGLIFPGNLAQFLEHRDAFGLNTDLARGVRLLFQPLLVVWALAATGALKQRAK